MGARFGVRLDLVALGLALALATTGAAVTPAPAQADPQNPATDSPADVAAALRPGVDASGTIQSSQLQLKAIESSIALSKERTDSLRHQIEAMTGDRAKQNAALIAAGQRVKIAETKVTAIEKQLTGLAKAEGEVKARLDGANVGISNTLAALQRISLNPPPPLIVNPSDALASARSALLISSILPQLRARAEQIATDLKHLGKIRTDAEQEAADLKANYGVLEQEQLRIATIIQARKQGVAAASAKLDAEQKEAEALGAKATSLKELVTQLTAKVEAVRAAAGEAAAADAANVAKGKPLPTAVQVALANTARTSPAIPFNDARGYLALPVAGTDVMDFGAPDGFGGVAEGQSFATRPSADVVAPADGWVVYKGPYLNYGQIVILNPGAGYTFVLAGLGKVSVDIGQFVLMGEPIGTMGSHTIGRTLVTSAGVSRPTLYIELRKNDEPVDPSGWWAPHSKTQSG